MTAHSSHTENELFIKIASGSEDAFSELFRRYDKRIYPFVLKMIKSELLAEEATQEIFIKLWDNREKLATVDNPEAYIMTVTAHHTLDQIKKQLNQQKLLTGFTKTTLNNHSNITEEAIMFHDSAALVEQAVNLLPDRQKQVYRLSRQQGLSYDEIADQLHISRITVRNHLTEALRFIRNYLEQNGQAYISLVPLMWLLQQ